MKKIILFILITTFLTSCTSNVQSSSKYNTNGNIEIKDQDNAPLNSAVEYSNLHEFAKQYEKYAFGSNLDESTPAFFTMGILREFNKDEEYINNNAYTMPYEEVKEIAPLFFNEGLIKYYDNELYAPDINRYADIILEPFEIYDNGKDISVLYGRFINDNEGKRHWLYPVRYTLEPYILKEDEIPLILSDIFEAGEQRYRILNVENYNLQKAKEIYSSNGYGYLFEQKEYEISSVEDILDMSRRVNSQVYNELNATYILKNDIDMESVEGFLPIGKSDPFKYPDERDPNHTGFSGIFEGNNFTISNLTYKMEFTDNSDATEFIGFFSILGEGAYIKNLNIENANIGYTGVGNVSAGILAGRILCAKIENCNVSGTVKGTYGVGGLGGSTSVDLEDSYSEIINCKANVEVFGENWIGGLLGSNNRAIIRNCYVKGIVTCDKLTNSANMPMGIGGFAGHNIEAEIRDCVAGVWVNDF